MLTLRINHWQGDLPLPGQFLKSARGKFAYLILEVLPAKPGYAMVGRVRCEKWSVEALTENDVVHEWVWSKKKERRVAMQVTPFLRRNAYGWSHWCPACEQMHTLPDEGWTFNGNEHRPSWSPSFKHTLVHWPKGVDAIGIGRGTSVNRVCHYIVTDGLIQFCKDSWHGRSDIVAMPPIPGHLAARLDPNFGIETQD
jgi:hypothetical protein